MTIELETAALTDAKDKLRELNVDNIFNIDIRVKRSGAGGQYTSELEIVFRSKSGKYIDTLEYLLWHLGKEFLDIDSFRTAFWADAKNVYAKYSKP